MQPNPSYPQVLNPSPAPALSHATDAGDRPEKRPVKRVKAEELRSGEHDSMKASATGASAEVKRSVCDHCRRRRIRCDGQNPCQQCVGASLACRRDHVPKKRGPKRGHGRVINELRAAQESEAASSATPTSGGDTSDGEPFHLEQRKQQTPTPSSEYAPVLATSLATSEIGLERNCEGSGRKAKEKQTRIPRTAQSNPGEIAPCSAATFQESDNKGRFPREVPRSTTYYHLIPRCINLYYDHIYPIMPLIYMPKLRRIIARSISSSGDQNNLHLSLTPHEKNLIYALCALTAFHMSGKSLSCPSSPCTASSSPPNSSSSSADPNGHHHTASWETIGRFFLRECITVRRGGGERDKESSYDFLDDRSLWAVISSFWLSTSCFEISADRKSWYYLREALTLALDLGLDQDGICDDSSASASSTAFSLHYPPASHSSLPSGFRTSKGLDDGTAAEVEEAAAESLCRSRVFWILFVTERSYAILRNKPLTLRRVPSGPLPARGHAYESPDIQSGFLKLVRSYAPLDENFVRAWNGENVNVNAANVVGTGVAMAGPDPRMEAAKTYVNLQRVLAQPPDFLIGKGRKRKRNLVFRGGSGAERERKREEGLIHEDGIMGSHGMDMRMPTDEEEVYEDEDVSNPEPTAIQKADLLMTQQWLRLIVWQSSFRQGLLSTAASEESMSFSFPLRIARDTATILQSLPSSAVEVHGMGIFEKIFEIGTWCVNVLGAYDHRPYHYRIAADGGDSSQWPSSSPTLSPAPWYSHGTMGPKASPAGMDYIGGSGGDLGLLAIGHGGGSGRLGAMTDPVEFFVKMLSSSPNSRTMFAERLLMLAAESPGSMRSALSPALSSSTSSAGSVSSHSSVERECCGSVVGEVGEDQDIAEDEQLQQQQSNYHVASAVEYFPLTNSSTSHSLGIVGQNYHVGMGGMSDSRWDYQTPTPLSGSAGSDRPDTNSSGLYQGLGLGGATGLLEAYHGRGGGKDH